MSPIFEMLGKLILACGGISYISYQIFKYLGSKWLDNKFDERLQKLKHEQGKEIENLKLKISTMLDRAIKLNQREFEVLPIGWDKLNDSFYALKAIAMSLQTFPDLDTMDEEHFGEFVDGLEFLPWEKRELRKTTRKNDFYQKQITARRLGETKQKISDAAIYFSRSGVFIRPQILKQMKALNDIIWGAYVEFELSNRQNGYFKDDRLSVFIEKGDPMLSEIEQMVKERLWPENESNSHHA